MTWFDGRPRTTSSSTHYRVRRYPSSQLSSSSSLYSKRHPHRPSYSSRPRFLSTSALSDLTKRGGYGYGYSGTRSGPSVLSSSSWSSRRARPRHGYVKRTLHYIKRLFRDIYRYARRHPYKVFVLVIVPLVLAGVFQKLLAMVGVHISDGLWGSLPSHMNVGSEVNSIGGAIKESLVGLMNIARELM